LVLRSGRAWTYMDMVCMLSDLKSGTS
jgi:hypothetical protein